MSWFRRIIIVIYLYVGYFRFICNTSHICKDSSTDQYDEQSDTPSLPSHVCLDIAQAQRANLCSAQLLSSCQVAIWSRDISSLRSQVENWICTTIYTACTTALIIDQNRSKVCMSIFSSGVIIYEEFYTNHYKSTSLGTVKCTLQRNIARNVAWFRRSHRSIQLWWKLWLQGRRRSRSLPETIGTFWFENVNITWKIEIWKLRL